MSYLDAASTFANALTNYYFPDNNNIVDMPAIRRKLEQNDELDVEVMHKFQTAVYDPLLILRHRSKFLHDEIEVAMIKLFLESPGDFSTFIKCEDIPILRNPEPLYSMADVIGVSRDDCDTIRHEIISLTQNLKQWR
jgi:hypothetical protein